MPQQLSIDNGSMASWTKGSKGGSVSRQNERGDLLVFLSGLNEITALAEPMREYARETKKSPPRPLPSY